MALVTMVGTWGSTGHRDILRLVLGEGLEGLMLSASSSMVVGFISKETSEPVMLVGEVEEGKGRVAYWVALVGVVGTGVPEPDLTAVGRSWEMTWFSGCPNTPLFIMEPGGAPSTAHGEGEGEDT